jgi:CubicO group peptidase (beta-lactamase class C family)
MADDLDASPAAARDVSSFAAVPRTGEAILAGVREGLHLGAQLYVSRHGEVIADAAAGECRPGQPLRRDQLMLWLSSTKPVAAVAIAQLWQRGLLEIDDPRWGPGRKAGYHHASSWFLLGEVVRRLDGRPFSRYVRQEIFEPFGMLDSWVGMPVEVYRDHREHGRLCPVYDTERPAAGAPTAELGWDSEAWCTGTHPGGNGYGPVSQLGRFYEMLLGRGRLAGGTGDGGRSILSPQAVEALTARHRAGMLDHTFQHVLDWGLGFIVNSAQYGADVPYGYGDHASPRTFGHSGYRSSAAFADPEQGLAVALAFNGTPANDAHERRIRAVLDALYEDLGLAAQSRVRSSHSRR